MAELTEDENNVLAMHAQAAKLRHLTPSALAQLNYELQKKGMIVEAGCCGKHDLTEAAVEHLWEKYRSESQAA